MCNKLIDNNTYQEINESLLKDESYTLSYNFDTESWLSYHAYLPSYFFSLRNNQLLSIHDNNLYLHNQENTYCKFYNGFIYESYITPVFNPSLKEKEDGRKLPFLLSNLTYNCDFNNLEKRLLDKTFTYISLHNSYQGTIKIPLLIYDKECLHIDNYKKTNVRRVKNHWEFNYFKDQIFNNNINSYFENIDDFIELNTADYNCGKPLRKRFIDDWVVVKLTYDNKEQLEMNFYELNFNYEPIKR